jgi:hypothetical protein
MPRTFLVLACLAIAVQAASAQTLAPGEPAGAKAAQHISQRSVFIGVSIIAIILAFTLPSSSASSTATSAATTG